MSISDLNITGYDRLSRAFILPKKILWAGDGVTDSEQLLDSGNTQIFVFVPKVTKLSGVDGKKGAILLDFGSELVGSLELLVSFISNPKGVKLHLRFGESVSEAMTPISQKNATNDHALRDMEVTVTALSQQMFGYTGYRFVYLELAEEDTWVEFAAIRGIFTYRDIPYKGSFVCDNPLLNQIYNTSAYTIHVNMQNMLWDGIKRDRLIWAGDMHPEMLALRSVFGNVDIIDDCLRFVANTNPLPKWPNHFTTYGLWYLLILWDWYWYTGNEALVCELQQYWRGLLSQLSSLVHKDEEELLCEEELSYGFFLDWPTKGTEEAKAGIYALFRLTLLASARLCAVVGTKEEENQCLVYAELFASKNPCHNRRKQIVAMLQLADMIDKEEAGEYLKAGGARGMSTFMSYYILSAAASTAGMECAQEMLCEYYGAMLQAGATTFWEDFDIEWFKEGARIDKLLDVGEYDIHGDNGRFCYTGLRHSLCHGWSAGPAAFLPERVLGIEILEPGCKKIAVKPELGNLNWAKGTYPTPYGIVSVEVEKRENTIVKKVSAPPEITVL